MATAEIKTVIKLQLMIGIILLFLLGYIRPEWIKSLLYGEVTALINTGMLYWRLYKSHKRPVKSQEQELALLYRSGLERFILIAGLLAMGMMAKLHLVPLVVLTGFMIEQLVFLLGILLVRYPAKIKTET
ncbi:hypothetical protein SFSGTM_31990 [Sulfuriferula nivalis]|uniref:ATP synthase protein I2 n=2 Tax=Sulfuriferula nivalis TaxID=2675298 RepID=A0A809RU96_9PROT|nr:hypothetical protein SFSGTM_31990 [Sulfuriferula nivalis]